jgi:hypothetical protein
MAERCRKKPVVIEAVQWTGGNLREVIDFVGLHPSAQKWTWEEYEQVVQSEGLKIFTLEGSMMATIGDFIIKGVQGEPYPCKPDIFAKTYEAAATEQVTRKELAEAVREYLAAQAVPYPAGDMADGDYEQHQWSKRIDMAEANIKALLSRLDAEQNGGGE